jgi:glycosyltransferase involved in cell wall biosynthesis
MLAIIIPYYKSIYFKETLSSLVAQTNKNFNIYIGDDNSPEDPRLMLKDYQDQLNINYKRFERNLGSISLTKQWERCIELTKNENWLMILGDDDKLSPEVVQSFYDHYPLFNNKSNVIRFGSRIIFEETNSISGVFQHPIWEKADDSFLRRYRGETRSSLSEYIFSKKKYQKYGFYNYPLAWHSDDRAWLEITDNKPIYSINESIIYFRESAINITGRIDNEEQKKYASKEFYKHLSLKHSLFSKEHRLMFARIHERYLRNDGEISVKEWLTLAKIYITNFEKDSFIKFTKRFVKGILHF